MKTFWTAPGQGATTAELRAVLDEAERVCNPGVISGGLARLRWLGNKKTNLGIGDGPVEDYDITRIENAG